MRKDSRRKMRRRQQWRKEVEKCMKRR